MKTIAKALITLIIIFSVAVIAGERKVRINLAVQTVSKNILSKSEDAGGYQSAKPWKTEMRTRTAREVATRKNTVARPV